MRAIVLERARRLRIEEREVPSPAPGELLLKVEACALGGRDYESWYHGLGKLPRVPGSEIVGTVEALGNAASPSHPSGSSASPDSGTEEAKIIPIFRRGYDSIADGSRVVVSPYLQSRENTLQEVVGYDRDGGLQEYMCLPVEHCFEVEADRDIRGLACVPAFAEALAYLDELAVEAGEVVVVSGAEGIGVLTAMAANLRGATAVLVDPKQARLEQASEIGIPYVVNPFRSSVPDELGWITPTGIADVVVETTGNRDALPGLFAILGPGSRLGFVHGMEYDISIATLVDFGLRLVGLGSLLPNFREAIELTRGTEVAKAVSLTLPLEELPDRMMSIARSREAVLKAVVAVSTA